MGTKNPTLEQSRDIYAYSPEMVTILAKQQTPEQTQANREAVLQSQGLLNKPKSVSQMLYDIKATPLFPKPALSPVGQAQRIAGQNQVRPFAGYAGLVSSVEAPIYFGARLAGFQTPSVPSAAEPEFVSGVIMGNVLQSMVIGKIWDKTIGSVISKAWKGSGSEEWLIEHSGWYAKHVSKSLAPEIFSPPSKIVSEPISMAGLKEGEKFAAYEGYFWDKPSVRSAEMWISKTAGASSRVSRWASEALVRRVTGGLSYALITEEITKIQPTMPYIPSSAPMIQTSLNIGLTVGIGAMVLKSFMSFPKEPSAKFLSTPTFGLKSSQFLKDFSLPREFSSLESSSILDVGYGVRQSARAIQSTSLKQSTKSMMREMGVPRTMQVFEYPRFNDDWSLPRKKGKRKRGKESFYGRYPKSYPVATPKQVYARLFS